MREGPICRCPECREGTIIALDNGLYTCTSCNKTWNLEEIYGLLWFQQLFRLIKLRQRTRKSKKDTIESLDQRISFSLEKIKELELQINDLEEALESMEYDLDDLRFQDIQAELEHKQHYLSLKQKSLQKLYRMRNVLTKGENNPSQ